MGYSAASRAYHESNAPCRQKCTVCLADTYGDRLSPFAAVGADLEGQVHAPDHRGLQLGASQGFFPRITARAFGKQVGKQKDQEEVSKIHQQAQ